MACSQPACGDWPAGAQRRCCWGRPCVAETTECVGGRPPSPHTGPDPYSLGGRKDTPVPVVNQQPRNSTHCRMCPARVTRRSRGCWRLGSGCSAGFVQRGGSKRRDASHTLRGQWRPCPFLGCVSPSGVPFWVCTGLSCSRRIIGVLGTSEQRPLWKHLPVCLEEPP